jgi:hypothetical protein
MKIQKSAVKFFGIAAALLLLDSCSAAVSGKIESDASGVLSIKAALEPKTAAALRSLGALGGRQGAAKAAVLDSQAINRSLKAAPGITDAALKNTSAEALEGTISVNRIGDFLASAGTGSRFITFEPLGTSGGRLGIQVDRESSPALIARISRDTADYLSVLMAPAATGEKLGTAEYLELVRSVYGDGIAGEMAGARFSAVLTVPGTIKTVRGGSFQGRQARFEAALLDILVLEQPLEYEIVW